MKYAMILCLSAVLLCSGCAAPPEEPVAETVQYDAIATVADNEQVYDISIFLPPDVKAGEKSAAENRSVYLHNGGDYELYTTSFLAHDAASAVRTLSGMELDDLTVIETKRFGLPEYRFAWYEEDLSANCRADVVQDGDRFYAVVFSVEEAAGSAYNELMAEVFSTIGLNTSSGK